MRKATALLTGLAGLWLLCVADVHACGDKFLVVGRGVRYSRAHGAVHAASILIYRNSTSQSAAIAKDVKLEGDLKQAGHKVQSVTDATALDSALKGARFDLVLADVADSPGLEKQVASQSSKPIVVPVLYEPTSDQLAAAKKQYGCAMKAPSKDYLSTIDEIMSQKLKVAEGRADKTK